MAFKIDLDPCINCSLCRRACPTECITYFKTGHRTHVIDPAGCIDCDICAQVCPVNCIRPDPAYVADPVLLEAAKQKARNWARQRRRVVLDTRGRVQAEVGRLAAAN